MIVFSRTEKALTLTLKSLTKCMVNDKRVKFMINEANIYSDIFKKLEDF